MPGRSLALVAMSAASGHSFSTSSRGPQMDLFCPMKDFLAGRRCDHQFGGVDSCKLHKNVIKDKL